MSVNHGETNESATQLPQVTAGLIEAEINGQKPVLTDIHGFVLHFSQFGGCSFYVHVNTSEINSGETFTP